MDRHGGVPIGPRLVTWRSASSFDVAYHCSFHLSHPAQDIQCRSTSLIFRGDGVFVLDLLGKQEGQVLYSDATVRLCIVSARMSRIGMSTDVCFSCAPCLSSCWSLAIEEGTLENVACPSVNCVKKRSLREPGKGTLEAGTELDPNIVEGVVGKELRDRWEKLKKKRKAEIGVCMRPYGLLSSSADILLRPDIHHLSTTNLSSCSTAACGTRAGRPVETTRNVIARHSASRHRQGRSPYPTSNACRRDDLPSARRSMGTVSTLPGVSVFVLPVLLCHLARTSYPMCVPTDLTDRARVPELS